MSYYIKNIWGPDGQDRGRGPVPIIYIIYFFLCWIGHGFHMPLGYQKSAKSVCTLPSSIDIYKVYIII